MPSAWRTNLTTRYATVMGAVRNMVESMFHDRQPETCPTDPIDRQERLQALATRAQRRALRAMFHGCWIPGCDVPFDNCTIHHLWWWEHLGPTDLTNLRPTCSRHHHDLHEGGWKVPADGWAAVITRPDGTQMHTGPPAAHAA